MRRKSGTEMCEMVGESADGVGMRYEVDVAWEAGGGSGLWITEDDVMGIGYGEWLHGRAVSGECSGLWAAVGPRTSGNLGTIPVTSGQQISRS